MIKITTNDNLNFQENQHDLRLSSGVVIIYLSNKSFGTDLVHPFTGNNIYLKPGGIETNYNGN